MLERYDIVIGLEIHAELSTNTKLFCGCANAFGSAPNTNCCAVCLGYPNAKPNLNQAAVEKTIAAGLAMGCTINPLTFFERKHYFYPDLSAGYQVSQLDSPICLGGGITLKSGKFIRLNRIHLEEDAAKLIHNPRSKESMVDYNRGGVPLNEIVTEPDLSSAEEAVEFLEEVRSRLIYAGVADCKMEEGGMRCDVNLSLKPKGSKVLGARTEMKNLNSFKMVARTIEFESRRQAELLDEGKTIKVETRRWDDAAGETFGMRSKETALDYRYMLAPNLPAIRITAEDIAAIQSRMPMLAHQLKEKLLVEFGLPPYDADVILQNREVSKFYVDAVNIYPEPKKISNFLMTAILAKVKGTDDGKIAITAKQCADLVRLIAEGKISRGNGLIIMEDVWGRDWDVETYAKKSGRISDVNESEVLEMVKTVLAENQAAAVGYKENPDKILNFLTGKVMKLSGGKADSKLVKQLLEKALKN